MNGNVRRAGDRERLLGNSRIGQLIATVQEDKHNRVILSNGWWFVVGVN